MKIGFCLHGDWLVSRPELVKLVDELGYDGIEIWAQAFDAVGLDEVKGIVAQLSCEVASINPYLDFTGSEESYAESLETADVFVEYARALKCSRLRTFTSKMKAFQTSDEAEPVHWERAASGIREVCDRVSTYGITCLMEVHYGDGQLYDTSDATIRLLGKIGRDNCAVNLQTPLRGEDPYESADRLGPYVAHLHAHNWYGEWGSFARLGDSNGDLDFETYLRILRRHGFDGYISIEHAHKDPAGIARHEISYLRDLITRLEERESAAL